MSDSVRSALSVSASPNWPQVPTVYLANSLLINQTLFKNSGALRMSTTKQYDLLNRLTNIVSSTNSVTVAGFAYSYNSANQRIRRADADGSYWSFNYDYLGQVRSAKKYWPDMRPVAGQQFEYAFDDIGNRRQTKAGGDENGLNLRPATYAPNNLNQYITRDVPGAVDVTGIAIGTATVTVNSQSTYRKGEYFRKELTVANGSTPVWQSVTVAATGEQNVTGSQFVPKTQEQFYYDLDGNLTNDGRWTYTWDAENRLTKAESASSAPTASKRRVTWEFDRKGRRVRQTTYDGSSGSYIITEDLKFLSDGWRHIAELNAGNNALVRSYAWGLDLSGAPTGAGGIGGLLWVYRAANGFHFYAYDGNGNVAGLVKAQDGSLSAQYDYEPFGTTIRSTGLMRSENPFRFSTKRTDATTDLILYEHRPLSTSLGRWLSRDPLEDYGFRRLQNIASVSRQLRSARGGMRKPIDSGYILCENHCTDTPDYLGLCGFGQAYVAQHPEPNVSHPINSPKGGEQLCCVRQRHTPKGHSDFYGAEEFHFEYYDIWNPPFPVCGDPSKHFGDRGQIKQNVQQDVNNCDARAFSADMHQLQDTYCHSGFQWDPCTCKLGHLWASIAGHDPDTLAETNGLWDQAQAETATLVNDFRGRCGWGEPVQLDPPYEGRN